MSVIQTLGYPFPDTLQPRHPRHGLTSPMATAPPFATASQRPALPPRRPSPLPAFSASPPAASQTAVPPSARTSIVHVPSRSQSLSTESSPCRASQRSRSPRQRVSPDWAEVWTRSLARGSLRPPLLAGGSLPLAFCSVVDFLPPRS